MAVILVVKEDLRDLLEFQLYAWQNIGGGPNPFAYEFDPLEVDHDELRKLGYYKNREAWIAGVQVKKLKEYLEKLEAAPPSAVH